MPRSGELSAFLVFLVLGILTASLGASLPYLREQFSTTRHPGSIVTFYNAGALVSTVVIGLLGRRMRVRPAIGVLLAVFAGGAAGMGLSPAWSWYLSFATMAGVGYGGLTLLLNTAFARGFGDRSVVMVNRLNAVFGIGAMLGPLAAGAVGRVDIRLLALITALIALVCVPVWRAGVVLEAAADAKEHENGSTPARHAGLGLPIVLFLAVGLCYAGTETSIGAWQSTQLVRSGWDTQTATLAASGFWAGMAVGRLVVPRLTRHLHPSTSIPLYLSAGTAMLLLAAVPNAAVVAYPLAGLCLAPVLPTLISWLSGLVRVPQRATSALTLCCMLGNAALPAAVQALVGGSRLPESIAFALAGSGAVCLLFAVLTRRTVRGTEAARPPGDVRGGDRHEETPHADLRPRSDI
ncbi:hypothetical protein GCM10010145_12140 [Streptomyces ruber]|uniref:MFS transporter n=3 Tax=Streptomyces TaxID=1883 RepID=A0A918B8J6_9ACTN|nr:hypothetical protein GCM10010145_12140 [Streptomyces ruber]